MTRGNLRTYDAFFTIYFGPKVEKSRKRSFLRPKQWKLQKTDDANNASPFSTHSNWSNCASFWCLTVASECDSESAVSKFHLRTASTWWPREASERMPFCAMGFCLDVVLCFVLSLFLGLAMIWCEGLIFWGENWPPPSQRRLCEKSYELGQMTGLYCAPQKSSKWRLSGSSRKKACANVCALRPRLRPLSRNIRQSRRNLETMSRCTHYENDPPAGRAGPRPNDRNPPLDRVGDAAGRLFYIIIKGRVEHGANYTSPEKSAGAYAQERARQAKGGTVVLVVVASVLFVVVVVTLFQVHIGPLGLCCGIVGLSCGMLGLRWAILSVRAVLTFGSYVGAMLAHVGSWVGSMLGLCCPSYVIEGRIFPAVGSCPGPRMQLLPRNWGWREGLGWDSAWVELGPNGIGPGRGRKVGRKGRRKKESKQASKQARKEGRKEGKKEKK